MSCQLTGAYADWVLTPAQGGTFVELEMGMQPKRLGHRLMDIAIGRSYFRRWSKESLDGTRGGRDRQAAFSEMPRRGTGEDCTIDVVVWP